MKGVVFTEFLSFVEGRFDLVMVDHLITATDPASGGAYTAVGTYDASELVDMVAELSLRTGIPAAEWIKAFGGHLFQHFVRDHAATMGQVTTSEALLSSVEDRIHVDVRKLFPDAELPTIGFEQIDDRTSEVTYQSTRPFADLAEGLIAAAIKHFADPITMTREDLHPGDGTRAKFKLVRR
ncbi:heme NO-binding domain-containing protein [Stieleria sp.]|uniref:heme NO-binding domain-containing protein n=1 Tax=Stieleria sp. TaxID=2795976 RepID=UPI0035675A70